MDVAMIELNLPKKFYISSVNFAQPSDKKSIQQFKNFIKNEGINTIVNVSDFPTTQHMLDMYNQAGVSNLLYYPLKDEFIEPSEYANLKIVLDQLYNKMGKNVLVHCTAGINRSALVIAHSLLKLSSLNANEIIDILKYCNKKTRNTFALTNPTFVNFLKN